MEVNDEETAVGVIMEVNDEETAGAQPYPEDPGSKFVCRVMELMYDEETAGAQSYPVDPGSKLFYTLLVAFSSAYHKERSTSTISSTLFDYIVDEAYFLLFFATVLFFRFANLQVFFCSSLALVFLSFCINYAPLLFLKEDINWISRESRLLRAISEDAEEVVCIGASLEERAHEVWCSNPCPGGITINRLDESEKEWLKKAKSTAQTAKDFILTFVDRRIESPHTSRISCGMMTMITANFLDIWKLLNECNNVKKKIDEVIAEKEKRFSICESLERSRSIVMSLQNRPFYPGDQQILEEFESKVATAAALTSLILEKIGSLINRDWETTRKDVHLQLLLMLHFLENLKGCQLDSKIARAWVEEAAEMITEAHTSISKLERPASQTWRLPCLPIISEWKARRQFKGIIRNIDTRISELLESKNRYGFKFIIRDSKVVYRCPHNSTDDSVVSSMINKMRYHLSEDSDILAEVSNEVRSLCDQLARMQKLVDDAVILDGRYNSRTVWLEQAGKIARSVDLPLDTFMKKSTTVPRNSLLKTAAGLKFSLEYEKIERNISIFTRCINSFGGELREESNSVFGFEEDIQELVSRLTSSCQHEFVVSIAGIRGIGKTTLANEVYKHQVIVDHFPCHAWVTLHESWNRNAVVVEKVAEALKGSLKSEKEENRNASCIQMVRDRLNEKRYLIILDNISSIQELDSLKAELLVPSSGSRILLTSCENNLLPSDCPTHLIRLRSTGESWKLLNRIVQFPPEQQKLAKEILTKCGGLPQSILRLGYLISGKNLNSPEELRKILQYIKQNDTALIESFRPQFIPSVPDPQLGCLSYLKLFPRDFEIPTRRLICLWIADDLIYLSEYTSETYEDVAHEYLKQLVDWGVIQVVERKHNGEVKKCRLPYALQKHELKDLSSKRITDHFNRSDATFAHIHGESSSFPSSYRDTVSFLSFDTREGNKPGAEIGQFLHGVIASWFFRQLIVLDLEKVFRPELPDTIGRLSKLRYLGLRWTYLESIPSSIGKLHNLQTLDVKHTYIDTLPSSIWKLQKLRHLYLNNLVRQQGGSSLKNLQTLWGVFVDKDSPLKDGLDKLLELRKLGLVFDLPPSDQKVLSEKIVKLNHLKSLRMRSIDEMGEPCNLFPKPLTGLENLCSLNLFGKLEHLPDFPKSLIDLTLSASSLSDDPMPKIEKLPNLKVLCFYSKSFMGDKMTCSTLGFPQLVVLKLWKLENLQEWDVEEKAMQNLRELEIRSCKKLSVPSGLKHLITLNELKLTNMPEEFTAAIAKSRGKIWEGLNHSPAIIADNWESTE